MGGVQGATAAGCGALVGGGRGRVYVLSCGDKTGCVAMHVCGELLKALLPGMVDWTLGGGVDWFGTSTGGPHSLGLDRRCARNGLSCEF